MDIPLDTINMLAGRPAPDPSRLSSADRNDYEMLAALSRALANRGKDLSAFMVEGAMLALLSELAAPGQPASATGSKPRYGEVN
jgi:hypothetical protein